MSSVAFLTSRVISSTSASFPTTRTNIINSSTRSTTSRRRQSVLKGNDIRCISTVSRYEQSNRCSSEATTCTSFQKRHVFGKESVYGLSAAVIATAAMYAQSSHDDPSQCEADTPVPSTAATAATSMYETIGNNNLRTLRALENFLHRDEYQASPTASTGSIPGRVIDVVKASVDTASEWEKKAKETVRMMTNQYPAYYDVSVRALKGGRLSMEDKYCIHEGGRFAAVFDGHGGSCVSTYLSETLHNKIQHRLKSKEEVQNSNGRDSMALLKKIRILTDSISEVDEEILGNDDYQYQGSTAVAVWVHEDDDKGRTLVSANVGDSRAVMSQNGRVVDLTKDHKPNDPEEKKRIHAMGEKIEWDPYCNLHRVRNLSLSRAIGDKFAKPAVCSEVDIKTFPLHNSGCDDFVVLASDGLWDVMSSQDCVDFINDSLNPSNEQKKNMSAVESQRQKFAKRKNMSRLVANEALSRGTFDNVCVIIIWLNKPDHAS